MIQPTDTSALDKVYKTLIIITLVIALLVMANDIVIPFAFACLFSVVLLPVVKRIEEKIGRILAITIVLITSLSAMFLLVWLVVDQLTQLAKSLPNLEQRFVAVVTELNTQLSGTFGISSAEQIQLLKEGLKNLSTYVGSALLSVSFLVYFFVQVPIYIFLLLLYREKFNHFFLSFTEGAELRWKDEITGVVRGYISGLFIVVIISGTLNSIGLLIIGIDNALFFGFLIGALTMIPYVGIIIGATFPALFALLTKDSLWYPVGVLALHFSVQFLEANFITPKITGSRISVNALAAIVALLIGEKILGVAGMILAVPAVGIARILLSYSGYWKPFVILLEDKPSADMLHEPEPQKRKKRKKK
jgi:predicted PurR-regulated permease PerM